MKKIDIKAFYQNPESLDCGPVAVRMILNHFGIERTEDELRQGLTYEELGTYIYDNGIRLLQERLRVTLVTANPLLFEQEVQGKLRTKKSLFAHLTAVQNKYPKKEKALALFKSFVDHGGRAAIEIPTIKHIMHAIDDGGLVLALVFGKALGRNEGGFHYVVVSGYKKDFVYLNNPSHLARQGWFPQKDFIYALYTSTCADVDNGSLLLVHT